MQTVTEPSTTAAFLDEIHPTEAIQRPSPKIIIRPTVNATETTDFPDYPPLDYDDSMGDYYTSVYENHLNSSFLKNGKVLSKIYRI